MIHGKRVNREGQEGEGTRFILLLLLKLNLKLYRVIGSYKVSTERSCVAFTQFPLVVKFYIIIVQSQNQAVDSYNMSSVVYFITHVDTV